MTRIAGIILAAGASTRFGQPKQLLDWNGIPLVAHVADTALAAGLDPVIVVLGYAAAQVQAALSERPVRPVMNWRWEQGLSTSVQLGLALVPPDADAAIFLHCDQPLVSPALVGRLIARFRETLAPAVHPVCQGRQATPVLFARAAFPELAAVSGDQGGRSLIARLAPSVATVEVEEPDLLADVDTPDDYERLVSSPGSREWPLREIRHLIVDMDGVLWRGDQPAPGLADFFRFLQEYQFGFVLATNNASRGPEYYVEKLSRLGAVVDAGSILTSAQATAAYLASVADRGTPVFVIGAEGLRQALAQEGFVLTEEGARYVVVGWDPELTWQKLARATLLIRAGAEFIGTNPDVTYPTEAGLVPGNGAQLVALEAATGATPVVIGKPQPWLFREAMRRLGGTFSSTAVVGDRLDTDIVGGRQAGLFTVLVLSGITTARDLATSPIKPDLVCADVGQLARRWQAALSQKGPHQGGSDQT